MIAPTAAFDGIAPTPRSTPVDQIRITFSEPVFGLIASDPKLARNGGGNLLTSNQTLSTNDDVTWTLADMSGLTTAAGSYTVELMTAGSDVTDLAGNSLANSPIGSFTVRALVATTTSLVAMPSRSIYRQSVTFTATVSSASGTPTGLVQFAIDGTNYGSPVRLVNGMASLAGPASLGAATHTITAAYGDPDVQFETSSASAMETVVVAGDMNGDEVLDNFDIEPFERALTDTSAYLAGYPDLTDYELRGDMNGDGSITSISQPLNRGFAPPAIRQCRIRCLRQLNCNPRPRSSTIWRSGWLSSRAVTPTMGRSPRRQVNRSFLPRNPHTMRDKDSMASCRDRHASRLSSTAHSRSGSPWMTIYLLLLLWTRRVGKLT